MASSCLMILLENITNSMAEISFYHLTSTPVSRALPSLVEKAYEAGMRVLVLADKTNIKQLDDMLWTANSHKFLPHGTDNPQIQPIFISDTIANDNRPVLAITNGAKYEGDQGFAKVLDIFDGNIDSDLNAARERWQLYKAKGFETKYWFQDDKGKWVQK